MNFNLGNLENLFTEINNIINYVIESGLKNKRNTLYLSNEDKSITYHVPENAIPHLLGINTIYLESTGLFKSKDSFNLLKELCQNPFKINTLSREGIIDQNKLFSKHILEKIEIFKENIRINTNETEFICKYNKEKSFYSSKINENCDYIIVKKYEDDRIGIILLAEKNYIYVPMSSRIYKNIDEADEYLKKLLVGQEITFLSGTRSYNSRNDYNKSFPLNSNVKREKFQVLKEYKKRFNCSIDLSNDYEYLTDRLLLKRDEGYENGNIINEIVEAIMNGKIIEIHNFSDLRFKSIVDAWNDHLCNNPVNTTVTTSYTDMKNRLEFANQLITSLGSEVEQLNSKIKTLTSQNEILTNENETYKKNEEAIIKILKKPEN